MIHFEDYLNYPTVATIHQITIIYYYYYYYYKLLKSIIIRLLIEINEFKICPPSNLFIHKVDTSLHRPFT